MRIVSALRAPRTSILPLLLVGMSAFVAACKQPKPPELPPTEMTWEPEALPSPIVATVTAASDVAEAHACEAGGPDADEDGLPDACEVELGARFAPIVYHSSSESNFPTNVDAFLARSTLSYYDDGCRPDLSLKIVVAPTQLQLLDHRIGPTCGSRDDTSSVATRSRGKHRTFYLTDVPNADRRGASESADWTTYLHAYPSQGGGVTLQYWRFYAYNDAFNDHGGDWEGLHIVLDAHRRPTLVRLLGHDAMRELNPSRLTWEGDHVRVFSEGGGHATRSKAEGIRARDCDEVDPCEVDLSEPATYVRQETWPGGHVRWPSGRISKTGNLLDVGEKRAPLNGQVFIRYSGLWGSPGLFYWTSGYWGPAFNETNLRRNGFVTAWCAGMEGKGLAYECGATDKH